MTQAPGDFLEREARVLLEGSTLSLLAGYVFTTVAFSMLGGCFGTHHPDPVQTHMQIRWRTDWGEALAAAKELERPILLVGVAGSVDGLC